MFFPALLKLVVNKGVDLSALADSSSVAVPVPFASTVGENRTSRLAGIDHVFDLQIGNASFNNDFRRKMMTVGDVRHFDARHCGAFDDVGRVGESAPHDGLLHVIGCEDRAFFNIDRLRSNPGFKLAYAISIRSSVSTSSDAAQICIAG